MARRLLLTLLIGVAMPAALADQASGITMRLNLREGQTFRYRLSMNRDRPPESSELVSTFTITRIEKSILTMDCKFLSVKVNGRDRTKELIALGGNQIATLPWSIYSRRAGTARSMRMRPGKKDLMSVLSEGGIYLAYFQRQEVKPGDSWSGSTTATGGCTGATFTLRAVKTVQGKRLAHLEVTKILFNRPTDRQLGPMTMMVDLSSGLPTLVDYKVKNMDSGRITHFRQTPAD